jgi:hypothetical protein
LVEIPVSPSIFIYLLFSLLSILYFRDKTINLISFFPGSSRQFSGFSSEVDEPIITHIWKRAGEFFPTLKELPLSDFSKSRKVRIGLRPYSESQSDLKSFGTENYF